MTTKVRSGQTVLFIGDSITDCGRRATERPLGNGYVKLFADMMTVREPEKAVTITNKGIGGDTVVGLCNRWADDVLRQEPDWLSIKIGINDLHGALNADNPDPIPPARFDKAYTDILERTRKALPKCRILLIDPFYISTDKAPTSFRRSVLDLLPEYVAVVHKMSRTFDTRLVKTHALFQKLLKRHEPDTFCPEPVHPNTTGHLAIAEAVYQALEK
jgi:acyl-CoA thioesterase I